MIAYRSNAPSAFAPSSAIRTKPPALFRRVASIASGPKSSWERDVRPADREVLRVIRDAMALHDLREYEFGQAAVKDPNLVSDLAAGRRIGAKVRARILAYIDTLDQGAR